MSFSRNIKLEIIENKPYRLRGKLAQAYGLFLFGKSLTEDEVSLVTELHELAELYAWLAKSLLGAQTKLSVTKREVRGRDVYTVNMTDGGERARLMEMFGGAFRPALTEGEPGIGAFLSGAFLACGSMSDPAKSYHFAFYARDRALGEALRELLDACGMNPGYTLRRGGAAVYLKECGQIEDLLTMMGATRSALSVIDVEMIKQVRNRANRATNCETANIDKQVEAAQKQMLDIETVLREVGEESLSDALLQAVRLRRENPDASLRELCALSPEAVSRSGLFHRYAQLARMAEQIRAGEG